MKLGIFMAGLSLLLLSCSSGSGQSSGASSGTYGNIEFNTNNLNLTLGSVESVTISLVNSSLSPGLDIPLSVTTPGVVNIPNNCQLELVPESYWGSCTFNVQATGAGSTHIVAGWGDWPATSELPVNVSN